MLSLLGTLSQRPAFPFFILAASRAALVHSASITASVIWSFVIRQKKLALVGATSPAG
ncbi:hypothetical protein [Yersinia enterocolitica]|uniref:hypothetical protein n=1 Tax=Yersinia enterocolitica TaxID=630 RepID=UPI003F482C4D